MVNKEPSPNKAPSVARRLRLPQLQMVRMAGDGANFREMAEALHVTQPAITKMAQELERTLGAEVFDRSASGRRLTAFGLAVLPHAQRSLAALGQLEEELPRYRDGDQPALRIGSPSFTAAVLLARPVARWLQQTPGARVQMSDGVSVQLLAALQAGDLDCVIGSFDEGSSSDVDLAQLHFERLYDDHVTFVVHPDTPGRTRLNKLGQLLDLPWVIPPRDSQVWKVLRQAFTAAGLALPSGVLETSSVQAIGAILSEAPGTVGAMRVDAGRYRRAPRRAGDAADHTRHQAAPDRHPAAALGPAVGRAGQPAHAGARRGLDPDRSAAAPGPGGYRGEVNRATGFICRAGPPAP